ncbi:MAG: glucose 1-dehydrogenase, partial [Pseudomonadales bacterium]|nr:glucose 1-dehydrogenase [Pseudomonadales bacterium]
MGIGRACAERLAGEGAKVAITDLADDAGESVATQIKRAGGEAIYLHHDVTSEAEWEDILPRVIDWFDRLDILVNNAGIAIAGPITEMTLDDFRRQNRVNLDGVFLGLKHCIPLIAQAGGGSIINLSSVAGLKASPGLSAYAMTKGGVRLLSKSVAKECANAQNNVRVNSVHPGIIETAIWDKMGLPSADGANRADVSAIAANAVPGGKLGKPKDIANAVLFLASDDSSYVNGSELVVDHAFSS